MLRRTCANTNHRHSICNMFSFQLLKNIQKMWCWKQGNMLSNKTCDPSILRNVLIAHVHWVEPLKIDNVDSISNVMKTFPKRRWGMAKYSGNITSCKKSQYLFVSNFLGMKRKRLSSRRNVGNIVWEVKPTWDTKRTEWKKELLYFYRN